MRLLVVGAGATGGYFGGRLAQAGRDVTFLVRPARALHLRENGLRIVSPHGDFMLMPELLTASDLTGPFDIVLLAVKAYSLDHVLDDFAAAIGADTIILPFLNGMKHIDTLIARFGGSAVAGGVCKVAAALDDDGRIVQLAKFQSVAYGEMSGNVTARMKALDAFMRNAGFDAKLSFEIETEMWEKWIFLAALGAITCLMRGTIGEVTAADGGSFANRLLDEILSVAQALGHPPREAYVSEIRSSLTKKDSPQTSSMYRDLKMGKPIEAAQIIGDLLARAQSAKIETPLLATAALHLTVYQNRLTCAAD